MKHFVLASLTAYAMFAERVFLRFSTGGRGILPVFDLWIIAPVALSLAIFAPFSTAFVRLREFWKYWFPYIAMSFLLPVLAVFFNEYPGRNALECMEAVRMLALLVVGSWIAGAGPAVWATARRYVFAAVSGEFVFAGVQFGQQRAWFSGGVCDLLQQWDVNSQLAYSERYILTARSIGTYLNPNTLGFGSVVSFWAAVILLRGKPRFLGASMAVATLLCSQSRGSTLALIISALVWFGYLLCSRNPDLRKTRDAWLAVVLIGMIAVTWGVVLFQDRLTDGLSSQNRFERGLRFLSEGTSADSNAAGRIGGWQRALAFHQDHLLGTWGEPRFMFRDIIDNDYVRALLQGSAVYLCALFLALLGALRQLTRHSQISWLLGLTAVVIGVNGMTAHPLSSPPVAIFWTGIGFYLQQSAAAQTRGYAAPAPASRVPVAPVYSRNI